MEPREQHLLGPVRVDQPRRNVAGEFHEPPAFPGREVFAGSQGPRPVLPQSVCRVQRGEQQRA